MKRGAAFLALGALAGCSLEPPYVRPTAAVPPAWPTGDAYPAAPQAALPSVSYRDIFRDPRLQAVIAQGLENNQDLRVALANIQSARALYRVQRAEILPQVDANAGVTTRRNATLNSGAGGNGAGGRSGPGGDGG